MSTMAFFATASGSAINTNTAYEKFAAGSDGSGTTISSSTANAPGTWQSLGAITNAWAGFVLQVGAAANGATGTTRFLVNLSIDGGSSTLIGGLFATSVTAANNYASFPIPLALPAGATVHVQIRSSTASATLNCVLRGAVASATTPPGFTTAKSLIAADTTTTRASSTNVPVSPTATAWTQLLAATAEQHGAYLLFFSDNGTLPATAQGLSAALATGVALSEVALAGFDFGSSTSNPGTAKATGPIIASTVASGQRLSLNIQGPTPGIGPDKFCPGLIAFY